jgi:DNA-directed RNA polymerase subunit M/transcription elongation factor TFIIS
MSVPLEYLNSEKYVDYRGSIMSRLDAIYTPKYIYFTMPITAQNEMVLRIENSIYQSSKTKYKNGTDKLIFIMEEDFINCYADTSYNVLNYLNNNNNFAIQVLLSTKLQQNIGFIDVAELVPEFYDKIIDVIRIRNSQVVTKKFSSLYKCPKCHAKRAEIEVVQMRSFDEPPNISAQCADCNHRWTMG